MNTTIQTLLTLLAALATTLPGLLGLLYYLRTSIRHKFENSELKLDNDHLRKHTARMGYGSESHVGMVHYFDSNACPDYPHLGKPGPHYNDYDYTDRYEAQLTIDKPTRSRVNRDREAEEERMVDVRRMAGTDVMDDEEVVGGVWEAEVGRVGVRDLRDRRLLDAGRLVGKGEKGKE